MTTKAADLDEQISKAMDSCLAGKYKKIRPVGKGAYGQVWLLQRLSDNRNCVAKVMATEKSTRYEQEVRCLAGCNHFAIVGFIEAMNSTSGPVILLEFCDNGDLSDLVKTLTGTSKQPPSEEFVGITFLQMCLALHHIHAKHMMHRDIKAANVMLTKSGLCKLSDFGFSRQFDGTVSSDVADTFLGTPYYLAPELWKRQKYSKKADGWSMGVLLYEMMTLKKPFTAQTMRGLMDNILSGNYEQPVGYSAGLLGVLRGLLTVDSGRRFSMADVLQQPIMRQYANTFLHKIASEPGLSAEERAAITQTVNEQMSNAANPDIVAAVQASALDDEPTIQIIREADVHIGSTKDWKPRYIALTDKTLNVARMKADKKNQQLELRTIKTVGPSDDGMEGVFIVALDNGYTVWIKVGSNGERDEWIAAIQAAAKTA